MTRVSLSTTSVAIQFQAPVPTSPTHASRRSKDAEELVTPFVLFVSLPAKGDDVFLEASVLSAEWWQK